MRSNVQRVVRRTSTATVAFAIAGAAGSAAHAFDLFPAPSCECPALQATLTTYETSTPGSMDPADFTVGSGLAQTFVLINPGVFVAIEIDATWTATAIPRSFVWEVYLDDPTSGVVLATGTWTLDASVGSGSGALRFDVSGAALNNFDTYTFAIRQVEPAAVGQSTLVWWAGDSGNLAPYPPNQAYYLDFDTWTREPGYDLRLRAIQNINNGSDVCGDPQGYTCDGSTDAGAVFYVLVNGPAGDASIRCVGYPSQAPECDTTMLHPAALAMQCGG